MSYDIDILPTVPEVVQWGDVLAEWRRLLGEDAAEMLGDKPEIWDEDTREVVEVSERLKHGRTYYFDLPVIFLLLLM